MRYSRFLHATYERNPTKVELEVLFEWTAGAREDQLPLIWKVMSEKVYCVLCRLLGATADMPSQYPTRTPAEWEQCYREQRRSMDLFDNEGKKHSRKTRNISGRDGGDYPRKKARLHRE